MVDMRFPHNRTGWMLCAIALLALAGYFYLGSTSFWGGIDSTAGSQHDQERQSAARVGLADVGSKAASPEADGKSKLSSSNPVIAPVGLMTLQYSRLSFKNSLATTLAAAATSNSAEDLVLVTTMLAACSPQSLFTATGLSDEEMLSAISASYEPAIDAKRILREIKIASAQIRLYCSGANINEHVLQMRRNPVIGQLRASPSAMVTPRGRSRDSNSYLQAATQILSSPEVYSIGLDLWLRQRLDANLSTGVAFSMSQRIYIEDSLFHNLSGTKEGGEVRQSIRCATLLICIGALSLSEHDQRIASIEASRLEAAIRQQRWDLLQI